MTEQLPLQDQLDAVHIDSKAFLRFAEALKLDISCSTCQSKEFTLVTTEADRSLALLDVSRSAPGLQDLRLLEQMAIECANCGHSQFFRRNVIARWLVQHP